MKSNCDLCNTPLNFSPTDKGLFACPKCGYLEYDKDATNANEGKSGSGKESSRA